MIKFKGSLFKQFAIFSVIAFIVTGIVLGFVISRHVSSELQAFIPVGELNQHILRINELILFAMLAGLLVLYLFLLRVVYNASKTLIVQNQSLQEQKNALEKSYEILQNTYKDTVITLSRAVDARDPYTAGHSERVAAISLKIAEKLCFDDKKVEELEIAALFHDIGKIGVPDSILLKPGKLDEVEFEKIKEHPVIGVNILRNIEFLKDILPTIRHHHERYGGMGYPDGISGTDIPIGSRIISIADTYDAMTSDRPYRKGLSNEAAILEIIRCKETQFDSDIVDIFLTVEPNKRGY